MNKIIHQIWIADSEDMMPCNLGYFPIHGKSIILIGTIIFGVQLRLRAYYSLISLISICCINLYLPNGNV